MKSRENHHRLVQFPSPAEPSSFPCPAFPSLHENLAIDTNSGRGGGCPHTSQCFSILPAAFCGYGWKILLCCTDRSCCSSLCELPMQSHSNHCVKSCAETHAWKGWEEDRILLDVSFPVLTNGDSLVRVFVAMNVCQTLSITRLCSQRWLNICWKSIPGIFVGKSARCLDET